MAPAERLRHDQLDLRKRNDWEEFTEQQEEHKKQAKTASRDYDFPQARLEVPP